MMRKQVALFKDQGVNTVEPWMVGVRYGWFKTRPHYKQDINTKQCIVYSSCGASALGSIT